jgi:HTH-type transcriptional regulator/antitoxin HigA
VNKIRRNKKMPLTFNPEKYKELLFNYQPKIIRTEVENEKALAIIEELMYKKDRTPEEEELYELLIILIEKFEQEYYRS